MIEIMIDDGRTDNDPSLAVMPYIYTFAELQQYIRLTVRRDYGWDACPQGEYCMKLIAFMIQSGPAIYQVSALKENGTAWQGTRVARSWPGAPPAASGEVLRPDYAGLHAMGHVTNHGTAVWTKDTGYGEFAYGHGSMISVGSAGPDIVWPMIPNQGIPQYADAVSGMGWLVGTNHATANPVFRLTKKEDGFRPPVERDLYLKVVVDGEIAGYVTINKSDIPLENKIILYEGMEELGTIPIIDQMRN